MREQVREYMYREDTFELFSLQHNVSLAVFIILLVWLPYYAKNQLNAKQQHQTGVILGWLVASGYLSWVVLEVVAGTFDIRLHLPFHLCRTANLFLPVVMIKRNYRLYEILYFWSLSGIFQGVFTPDITHSFPHFHFFRYWISHSGLIIAIVYVTVVYDLKPSLGSLWRAFIALNVYLLIAVIVNTVLDSNYFWICGKPPTKSLLDYMGPWPWYILTGEFVALIHFLAAYSPIYIINKKQLSI